MSYMYDFNLEERGLKPMKLQDYSEEQIKKLSYVIKYLSPSIQYANCGWHHAEYYVLKNEGDYEAEFVALRPTENSKGGRWYCVTGNSLGAIAECVWKGVFN